MMLNQVTATKRVSYHSVKVERRSVEGRGKQEGLLWVNDEFWNVVKS